MRTAFEFIWTQVNAWVQTLPSDHKLMPKLLNIRFAIEELLAESLVNTP